MPQSRTVDQLLRAALNASPHAYALHRIIRDEEGGFQDLENLYTSSAAAQMAGVASAEELVGKRISELYPTHRGTAVWEGYRRVADTGETLCEEVHYQGEGIDGWFETTTVKIDEQYLAISGQNITQRKRAQEQRLLAERTLGSIIAVAADAIICTDAAQRITVFNESAQRIFGYVAAEVLGKHFDFLMPESFRSDHHQHVQRFAAGSVVARKMGERQAVLGRRQNGEEFRAEASISKVDVGGTTTFTVTLRDIAARIRAEEVRARLAHLVASSTDGISCISQDGIILDWNPASEQITGYSAAEVLGTSIFDLIEPTVLPEQHAVIRDVYERLGRGEKVAPQEMVRRRKDGSLYDSLVTRFAIRDSSGAVVAIANALQDITERKRFERHQTLLATVSSALVESLDYEQTLATVARLCIPTFADLASLCLVDELPPRHRAVHRDAQQEASLRAIVEHPDYAIRPDSVAGEVLRTGKPVLHSSFPVAEHIKHWAQSSLFEPMARLAMRSVLSVPVVIHGNTVGVLSLGYSDSGRNYSAADVPLAEEIAHRAALAMENARLYKEARDAVQARDDLMAFVSHDLTNMLSPVRMVVTKLLRDTAATDQRGGRFFEILDNSSRRMQFLLSDLLNLANLEAGALTIKIASVDAAMLLSEVFAAAEPLATPKQIQLERRIAAEVGQLVCDPQRIFQVLFNLVSNAVQYVAPGGRIEVRMERVGDAIQVAVCDNGEGIPAERLPQLFKRYSKGHAGHNGLGLYISKSLVEAHGGRIWAESREGEGSTFVFTLPQPSGAPE